MVPRAAQAVRIGSVAALLVAGLGWSWSSSAVTLRVDGVATTVHSHASTVQGLLHTVGLTVGPHDELTPGLAAPLHTGLEITLDRGRLITLTEDGRTRKVWVTARSVDEALYHLGLADRQIRVSASRRARLPLSGLALDVTTRKTVTLVADGQRREVVTYAPTVARLVAEQRVTLGARDITEPARESVLADGVTVTVRRVTVRAAVETVTVEPPVSRQTDPNLMLDQLRVLDQGAPGRVEQKVEYLHADGVQIARNVLASRTLDAPRPRVVQAGTKPYPPDDTGLNWAALAKCEAGGNPRAVSRNGTYHGMYQFNVQMWRRMGGIGLPSEATAREQTYRAIKLYKAAGRDQWPHCGKLL